jgi:hypothetical protein
VLAIGRLTGFGRCLFAIWPWQKWPKSFGRGLWLNPNTTLTNTTVGSPQGVITIYNKLIELIAFYRYTF